MKKIFYFLCVIFSWNMSFSQGKYIQTDDFSENYYATVYIKDSLSFYNNQLSEAEITIYERYVTEKRVHERREKINVIDAELRLSEFNDIPLVSSAIFYEKSGTIIYDDFNFDGNWDFAIKYRTGETCKNNFYRIYLSDGKNFHYNEPFTNLAKENCNIFKIDRVKKELFTEMYDDNDAKIKNEYTVENGENLLFVKSTKEKWNRIALFTDITIKELKGKQFVTTHFTENMLDAEGVFNILSFKNEKGKKANIFIAYNVDDTCYLGYMLLDNKGNVEFSYPMIQRTKSDFTYYKNQSTLVFENKDSKYTIYENAGKVGINIISNGKRYNWVGEPKTKEGSLSKLDTFKIINMVKK